MSTKNKEHRCKAKAKSGKPCQAAATAGGLCFFHANPSMASELGRIGGRSNRHAAGENADPLPTLDNALAVRETVARLIAGVYAGKLNPRVAAGLAPLLNLQLRAIEATDLESQVAKLKKLLSEAEDRLKPTAEAARKKVNEELVASIERTCHRIRLEQSCALAGYSSSSNRPADCNYAESLPGGIEGLDIMQLSLTNETENVRSADAGSERGGKS